MRLRVAAFIIVSPSVAVFACARFNAGSNGGDAGTDVLPHQSPVVACHDVEGGFCRGALPVCCLHYQALDTCVATPQDCPAEPAVIAPIAVVNEIHQLLRA
jgi:hypothetical protein